MAGVGVRNLDLRSKLPSEVLKNFPSGTDNTLFPNGKIFTSHLRAEKVQPDVANDFVERPTAAIGALEMISDGDIAVWISGFSFSPGFAIWRVLGEKYVVDVFIALAVVALFGEPVNRDVVEVLRGHYSDAQRLSCAARRKERPNERIVIPIHYGKPILDK